LRKKGNCRRKDNGKYPLSRAAVQKGGKLGWVRGRQNQKREERREEKKKQKPFLLAASLPEKNWIYGPPKDTGPLNSFEKGEITLEMATKS